MNFVSAYRPLTEAEREVIKLLAPGRVTYMVGSYDKRMMRYMVELLDVEEATITEGQAAYLRKIAHRYRRQAPSAAAILAGR